MKKFIAVASKYSRCMRLHHRIGIYLLMWPTLWALWIAAQGPPPLGILTIFILGTIMMRSAGCVVNDYFDREIDGKVNRTKDRPIAAGDMNKKEIFILFGSLVVISSLLVLLTNKLTIILGVVGLILATTYPLAKRFSYLPQFHLGFAFSWGIPMAFSAILGEIPILAWSLFFSVVIWTVAYDTIYAMADKEEDILAGIRSTAILFGDDDRLLVALLHVIFLIFLLVIGQKLDLRYPYYVCLGTTAMFFVYQYKLIDNKEPSKRMKAFENNNFVGGIIFCGIAMSYHMNLLTITANI